MNRSVYLFTAAIFFHLSMLCSQDTFWSWENFFMLRVKCKLENKTILYHLIIWLEVYICICVFACFLRRHLFPKLTWVYRHFSIVILGTSPFFLDFRSNANDATVSFPAFSLFLTPYHIPLASHILLIYNHLKLYSMTLFWLLNHILGQIPIKEKKFIFLHLGTA